MNTMRENILLFVIALCASIAMFFIVWYLITFMDGMSYVCALCNQNVWQIPEKVTILGQTVKICRGCADTLEQLGNLFG